MPACHVFFHFSLPCNHQMEATLLFAKHTPCPAALCGFGSVEQVQCLHPQVTKDMAVITISESEYESGGDLIAPTDVTARLAATPFDASLYKADYHSCHSVPGTCCGNHR